MNSQQTPSASRCRCPPARVHGQCTYLINQSCAVLVYRLSMFTVPEVHACEGEEMPGRSEQDYSDDGVWFVSDAWEFTVASISSTRRDRVTRLSLTPPCLHRRPTSDQYTLDPRHGDKKKYSRTEKCVNHKEREPRFHPKKK